MEKSSAESLEEQKGTGRTEAFSDAIFAFAITLLVLNLKVPGVGGGAPLSQGLLDEWPTFFALFTSFLTVLIMWVNHHNMFHYIQRIDKRFMFLNGLLMLFIVLTPFTTSLVAEHVLSADAWMAAAIYSGTFLLLAIVWNVLWRYSSTGHRLLRSSVTKEHARTITRQYAVAPISYLSALAVSFVSGLAGLVVVLIVAGFYAVTATMAN